MEKELNIAAILKDKLQGTKLWSPICGECKLHLINMSKPEPIEVAHGDKGGVITLSKDGKYFPKGELILFPSKEMRDWSKFAWKKGDILIYDENKLCIFDKWANEDYTEIEVKYTMPDYGNAKIKTSSCYKETNEFIIKKYVFLIEQVKGVKLNLSTLEIEQPKQEFKEGDILYDGDGNQYLRDCIFIAKYDENGGLSSECALIDEEGLFLGCKAHRLYEHTRLATDSEKQQLYDALAKENKRWNPNTLQIEYLPKKYKFKPMDWCLMKYIGHYNNRGWELCQYAYTEHRTSICGDKRDFYHAVGGEIYAECIPYNDQTAHLLGATDKWKGGEG